MGVKNTIFYLDLKTLENKPEQNLKDFAKSEDLEVEDIIKIIFAEAKRIGEENKVKVTFKTVDNDEDSFRVVVESANVKYKGTIIYPYEKIKSEDFEFVLDSVCGTITLVNKKEECKKMSLTIDGAALDIFAMNYNEAKDFLKELSDRKGKKGYIEFPDRICFKHFGIRLNAQKAENGDVLVDSKVASVDVYNQEEFDKEFYFEPEKQEEYDVNIPLPDKYNYEKKDTKKKKTIVAETVEEKKEEKVEEPEKTDDISIEIPEIDLAAEEEKLKEEERQRDEEARRRQEKLEKEQEELERIRKKQDEELEKVKEKLKRELEEEINENIKKYDEENKKREANVNDLIEEVEDNLPEIEEEVEQATQEVEEELPQITGPIIVNPVKNEQKTQEEVNILDEEDEEDFEEIVNVPHKDGFAELQKKFKILTDEIDEEESENEDKEETEAEPVQEIKQPEEDFDIKDLDEVLGRTKTEEKVEEKVEPKNEIEELQKMFEENKKQQELLESRIVAKLEELKAQMKKEEPVVEVVKEEKVEDVEKPVEKKATKKAETKKTEEKEETKEENNSNTSVRSYTLESYKGLVDNSTNTLIVYFGQSKREIRKILGKPKEVKDYEEMELYDDFYVYYDEDNKCVGIGLYNDKKYENTLTLNMFDRNLLEMKYRHIVKLIKRNDPNSIEDDDGIISLKYGISVDPKESKDFQDDICDVIHIFQKGYYDEVYENF